MSCNRDGVNSQAAGSALGAGDTEVLQMSARNNATLWAEKPVTPREIPETRGIIKALNAAEADPVSQPFVVRLDSEGDYETFDTPQEAIEAARKTGGAAYVYEDTPATGNPPHSPVVIFDSEGDAMMIRRDYIGQVKTNEEIGAAIPKWLGHTTEPYDDWAFDPETGALEVYAGDNTETYQRADLIESIWGANDV